ncbi:aminotransferase class I/II-fold pyridoxal phosphate-dependent enzyme [Vibrio sp. PP-XX7]
MGDQNLNLILSEAKSSDVVMICNPHNPTGQFIPDLELYDLLQQIPKDVSVIIDEAYIDFVSSGHKVPVHLWINDFPNLLVVRSFSKTFGLAGLRMGYVIGNSRVIEDIKKLTMPF